jgi:hypothetical protein
LWGEAKGKTRFGVFSLSRGTVAPGGYDVAFVDDQAGGVSSVSKGAFGVKVGFMPEVLDLGDCEVSGVLGFVGLGDVDGFRQAVFI